MRCGLYVCVRDEYSEWGSVFLFLGFLEYEGGFVFVLSFGVSVNLSDFCLSDLHLILCNWFASKLRGKQEKKNL